MTVVERLSEEQILEVAGLNVRFDTPNGQVHAVRDLDLDVRGNEAVALVGESGSGKSVTALSIMGLLPDSANIEGDVLWRGRNVLSLSSFERRRIRGRDVAYVFQDPTVYLNPVISVGQQVVERVRKEDRLTRKEAREKAAELLAIVGIPDPSRRIDAYPRELSGGMRQRVMIAMALACRPQLLIADEPTTALDVTIQAQILDLLMSVRSELGMSLLLITHDLAVAAGTCDRVVVMYSGQAVESAPVDDLYYRPRMPYTQGLLASIPRIDDELDADFREISGSLTSSARTSPGCKFLERCTVSRSVCASVEPDMLAEPSNAGHLSRCWGTSPGGWL